jgi:hypothetical protein
MPHKITKPGRLANGRASGLRFSGQETHSDNSPPPRGFSSAIDFVAIDVAIYIAARYGLTPSIAAVIARCAGLHGGRAHGD